jgi:thioredoxin-dependent peroxiredoxin
VILGISFDTPAENKVFAEENGFPFRLLSDVDRTVGSAYETTRPPDDERPGFALRISYLIDPVGRIAKAYEVTDTAGHAGEVLGDLRGLQPAST